MVDDYFFNSASIIPLMEAKSVGLDTREPLMNIEGVPDTAAISPSLRSSLTAWFD